MIPQWVLNNKDLSPYQNDFTEKEWQQMERGGLRNYLETEPATNRLLKISLMPAIKALKAYINQQAIDDLEPGIRAILETIPRFGSNHLIPEPDVVLNWLGSDLANAMEGKNYVLMEELIMLLSKPGIRSQLENLQLGSIEWRNQDARNLLRSKKMTFEQVVNIAKTINQPHAVNYPSWVNHVELKELAAHFTPSQLRWLDKNGIQEFTTMDQKASLLRSIFLDDRRDVHDFSFIAKDNMKILKSLINNNKVIIPLVSDIVNSNHLKEFPKLNPKPEDETPILTEKDELILQEGLKELNKNRFFANKNPVTNSSSITEQNELNSDDERLLNDALTELRFH